MSRAQVILIALLLLLGLLVGMLALRTRQPPLLPHDSEHASFTDAATCLTCHGPDGGVPQSKNHPRRLDCMQCHGAAAGAGSR